MPKAYLQSVVRKEDACLSRELDRKEKGEKKKFLR